MSEPPPSDDPRAILKALERRTFIRRAAAGTALAALGGGLWFLASDEESERARHQFRADGRVRLPGGQRVISRLRPMGGEPGDPSAANFRLLIHGRVARPFELEFRELLALPQLEEPCDVHCVTGWSVLSAVFRGVQLALLAERARPRPSVKGVIFEAAWGYTANVPVAEALAPAVRIVHRLDGAALARTHGGPVRALVPDLYFWKSAKWLRSIRFVDEDEPGYWERRGYHNHGDPWREERYS